MLISGYFVVEKGGLLKKGVGWWVGGRSEQLRLLSFS
jgi:hypothetical protein